jgi:hypothetical protein
MSEPFRPGFLPVDAYLDLPREQETFLIKPLIPTSGAALLYGDPKVGKALSLDTPIPTPSGWRSMKDINLGDRVFGSNGKPCQVIATSPVMDNHSCFKITFSDGNSIVADANHEWSVFENCGHNRVKRILTTQELQTRQVHSNYVSPTGYTKTRWKIGLPEPLHFDGEQPLSLDPYCLGTWLGDGTSSRAEITSADPEVLKFWEDAGFKLNFIERYTHRIREAGRPAKFIHTLGLRNNKHIPTAYLYGSYETRLALLQGLMDTDGSCEKGNKKSLTGTPVFWNTNKLLTEQVYELAVSLGARVKWHEKRATLYGKDCGPCYYLSIRSTFMPFRLARKARYVTLDKQGFWAIIAIEPTESVPVKCLMVDATDHLYLAGKNCLPTHNSYMGIQLALALSGQSPDWLGFPVGQVGKILYLQLDTPRAIWAQRFSEMLHKGKLQYDSNRLLLADRESIAYYPFDILQPVHMKYLHSIVQEHLPVAVIVDTLRESHSGDENDSTVARNVISNLVGACHPAALIIISHSRKPSADMEKDILADARGSSYVVGRMDAIMRLTKRKLYYTGRSIEAGDIKVQRVDNGLWQPVPDETGPILSKVLADTTVPSLRGKARILATLISCSEEAAMSRIRRTLASSQPQKLELDISPNLC